MLHQPFPVIPCLNGMNAFHEYGKTFVIETSNDSLQTENLPRPLCYPQKNLLDGNPSPSEDKALKSLQFKEKEEENDVIFLWTFKTFSKFLVEGCAVEHARDRIEFLDPIEKVKMPFMLKDEA